MPDRSSEEFIAEGRMMQLSTATWSENKASFIEYRFNKRTFRAWTKREWAVKEREKVSLIDCTGTPDESVLKERYLEELNKIQSGTSTSYKPEPSKRFTWKKTQESKLKKLHQALIKGEYIQATWEKFQPLFTGQESSRINPIEWRATQWEIAFLIDLLLQKKLIENCNHIKLICHCFLRENNRQFNEDSLKSQLSEARKGTAGKKVKRDKLEELISSLR